MTIIKLRELLESTKNFNTLVTKCAETRFDSGHRAVEKMKLQKSKLKNAEETLNFWTNSTIKEQEKAYQKERERIAKIKEESLHEVLKLKERCIKTLEELRAWSPSRKELKDLKLFMMKDILTINRYDYTAQLDFYNTVKFPLFLKYREDKINKALYEVDFYKRVIASHAKRAEKHKKTMQTLKESLKKGGLKK